MAQGSSNNPYPKGSFRQPGTGEVLEVTRPDGLAYPFQVVVQWKTPGEGRETLNRTLEGISVLEVDHLATAAAEGKEFKVDALEELGQRPASLFKTRLAADPDKYSLKRDDEPQVATGNRQDLLLALELMLRCALRPFEETKEVPSWVTRSRTAQAKLLKLLKKDALFQPE